MAVLDAAARDKLPKGEFGLPGVRKFPMPDPEHAADAKGRATQQAKKGNLSAAELGKIRAKADKILTRGKLKAPKVKADKEPDPGDPLETSEGESSTEGM